MAEYLELQRDDIAGILEKYGLKLEKYESIEGGEENTTYLVSTQEKQYVLTIFETEQNRVITLKRLLELLEEFDFPTTRLQKLSNGDGIIRFKGKGVLLKPYITGRVVKKLNKNMVYQVGVAMANLHEIPGPNFLPRQHPYGIETFPRIMALGRNKAYEKWLAERYRYFQDAIPPNLPCSLIHGDVFYDNVIFEGEKFQAIIDFEDACENFKVFDLGMASVGLCNTASGMDLKKVRSLVDGYQQVRILEGVEKENLQLFIEYAAIATSTWEFWKYNIEIPNAEKKNGYWEMVKISKAVKAIPNEKFMTAVF